MKFVWGLELGKIAYELRRLGVDTKATGLLVSDNLLIGFVYSRRRTRLARMKHRRRTNG